MEDPKQEKTEEVKKIKFQRLQSLLRFFSVSKVWIPCTVASLFLAIALFLDWRVRDVCRWSRFDEMPSFSKRVDLISSVFKINTYHIYFVLDYKDYENKEKLLNDVNSNQKEIEKQLKKAGLNDNEITVSSLGEIYAYEVSTSESEKTLFGMNNVAIDIKTKNKKLYDLFSSSLLSILDNQKRMSKCSNLAGHSIQRSSREVFSFSFTKGLLKILDCTRINIQHCTLVESKRITNNSTNYKKDLSTNYKKESHADLT